VAIYNATRLREEERGARDEEGSSGDPDASLSPVAPAPSRFAFAKSPLARPPSPLALSERLRIALAMSDNDAEAWRQALVVFASDSESVGGAWSQESRLLYDLQAVCVDREHGIYTVDLVEWVLSLGQLPIMRQLPGHQEVAIVRHLRRARDRVLLVR